MNMATIAETAKTYENNATKNIIALPEVPTDLEIEDDEFEVIDKKTGQNKVIKQKIARLNGENYRIPASVLQQLKVILEDNPNLRKFKVKSSGTGMETRYQVIPLM